MPAPKFIDAPFRQHPEIDFGVGTGEQDEATELAKLLIKPERLDADILRPVLRKQRAHLLDRAPERVSQPYYVRDGLAPPTLGKPDGTDLLVSLITQLSQPAGGPEVFLIVGPAGAGKTYLLEALFTYCHEGFLLAKGKQQLGVRPIPILPPSLLRASSYSTSALFEAVSDTEFAAKLGPDLLDFLVREGRAMLMIDGLDEFFAEQEDFFDEIKRRYLTRASRARIFIVMRDSLLATSPNVQDLVGDLAAYGRSGAVSFSHHHLALWERDEFKRIMAWLRLEGRKPEPTEANTPRVQAFLDRLAVSSVMDDLARLPYYCERLLEHFAASPEQDLPADEYDLLSFVLDGLIEREWDKHRPGSDEGEPPETLFLKGADIIRLLYRRRDGAAQLAERGQETFARILEETAYYHRRIPGWATQCADNDEPGVDRIVEDLHAETDPRTWAIVNRIERLIWGSRRKKGARILRQFALFAQGDDGRSDFTHEIMADYLAARYAVRRIHEHSGAFEDIVGTPKGQPTPVFEGAIAKELKRD